MLSDVWFPGWKCTVDGQHAPIYRANFLFRAIAIPKGDHQVVFDFDPNYRTALTALLRNAAFPKFPDVKTLEGKEIVVSGNFVDYHGKAQIELTDPAQIKLVK